MYSLVYLLLLAGAMSTPAPSPTKYLISTKEEANINNSGSGGSDYWNIDLGPILKTFDESVERATNLASESFNRGYDRALNTWKDSMTQTVENAGVEYMKGWQNGWDKYKSQNGGNW